MLCCFYTQMADVHIFHTHFLPCSAAKQKSLMWFI